MIAKEGCYVALSLFHQFCPFIHLYMHTINFPVHLLNFRHVLVFGD